MKDKYYQAKEWLAERQGRVSLFAFVLGFLIDTITLNRVDQLFDNAILLFYLFLATSMIILTNRNKYKEITFPGLRQLALVSPFIIQLAFGALLSGYVIFYTKSASLAAAWPFMIMFYFLFLFNEKLGSWYQKTSFQIGMLGAAYFSFLIFFIPVITKQVGFVIFAASGFIAFTAIYWVGRLLKHYAHIGQGVFSKSITWVLGIYSLFFVLYITNIIPPIPLSLKHANVYHAVDRIDGGYVVTETEYPWWDIKHAIKDTVEIMPNERIYLFSSVFAPTGMDAELRHIWQYQDPTTEEWIERSNSTFTITGGRDGGFRWYSFYTAPAEGEWRVLVQNRRGQEVGRHNFTVDYSTNPKDRIKKVI